MKFRGSPPPAHTHLTQPDLGEKKKRRRRLYFYSGISAATIVSKVTWLPAALRCSALFLCSRQKETGVRARGGRYLLKGATDLHRFRADGGKKNYNVNWRKINNWRSGSDGRVVCFWTDGVCALIEFETTAAWCQWDQHATERDRRNSCGLVAKFISPFSFAHQLYEKQSREDEWWDYRDKHKCVTNKQKLYDQ